MSSVSRPRTRSQWDEYYKTYHNEPKGKTRGCAETGGKENGIRNVVDSESVDIDGGRSVSGESFGLRSVRSTKNGVQTTGGVGKMRGTARVIKEEEEKDSNVASSSRSLQGKRSDVESKRGRDFDNDYLEYLCLMGLMPKVGDLDNGVSKRGRSLQSDVWVDSVNLMDSEDLAAYSDDWLNEFVDLGLQESESSSLEDEDTSDSEYKEDESSSSDEPDGFDCSRNKNDAYVGDGGSGSSPMDGEEKKMTNKIDMDKKSHTERKNGKKEIDIELEQDDESDGDIQTDGHGCIRTKRNISGKEQERVVINIGDKEKFPMRVRKSPRFSGKKESDIAQAIDSETDESYHEDIRQNISNSTSFEKGEDAVTIANAQEKFPSVRKRQRINVRKKVEDDSSQDCLKKRKFCESEIMIDFDSSNGIEQRIQDKHLGSSTISTLQKKESDLKFSSLFSIPDSELLKRGQTGSQELGKQRNKRTPAERNIDLIKILVDSIDSLKGKLSTTEENASTQESLPLKFRFEDEVQPPPQKSEWEKEIDNLFLDLDLGLRESEIDGANTFVTKNDGMISSEIDNSPEACCGRGEHQTVLDEQIGFRCRHCSADLEIKHVLPPFYIAPSRRNKRKELDVSPCSVMGKIPSQDSARGPPDQLIHAKGTVWDLVSGVEKEMFPHQREGFEFMWKKIAGDINIENIKRPLPDDQTGCIISHAPGTGKSRMTIVFLMAFLKLYPTCCPVIIAPRGMLLTWEDEFVKWKANIAFHNLNNMELSGNEIRIAAESTGHTGTIGMTKDYIRLVKVYSWLRGRSVLGISYRLFESLVGENRKKGDNMKIIQKKLIEEAGLLVLDEGHTPRNDETLIWNALMKVSTQRRIILSGTPFQNNFTELYHTLCLVNPKFAHQIEFQNHQRSYKTRGWRSNKKNWMDFTRTIDKDGDRLNKIRDMLGTFVHLHKGTVLEKSLPGLRDTIVFLHPTELQKTLLKVADKELSVLGRTHLVSLISVHPSMVAEDERFSPHKNKLEKIELDLDEGVKIKFVMNLISLANSLDERVLIFSQYIDPLTCIKKMLKCHFAWNEGREVLYMDGQLDQRQRQESISSLNDPKSAAKVLLASEKACSEGINLVGASRVVLLDTVWNPSVERQAISRAYRLGQKRVVYVYRLIISGTEVRQYQLQATKDQISQLIFSPVDGQSCKNDASEDFSEDKILDSMQGNEKLRHIFDKTIHQPKGSNLLIETFGFVDR